MGGVGYSGTQFETALQEALAMGYEFTLEKQLYILVIFEMNESIHINYMCGNSEMPLYYPLTIPIRNKEDGQELAAFTI